MIDIVIVRALEVAAVSAMHAAYQEVLTHRKSLFKSLSTTFLYRDRKMRISIAEILRLQSGDRYVLMESRKRPGHFTPIGGVIRCFPSGLKFLREELRYIPENATGENQLDLRGFIKGSEFGKFLKWFYAESGRENQALAREVTEELQEIGMKSTTKLVKCPEFNLVRIVHEGPFAVPGTDYWQYRLFLVKELVADHESSKKLSDAILAGLESNRRLIAVTPDEIRLGRSVTRNDIVIGDSSGYLFSGERAGKNPRPLLESLTEPGSPALVASVVPPHGRKGRRPVVAVK